MEVSEAEMKRTCPYCLKKFSVTWSKNKHIKNVHHQIVEDVRKSHIVCPLCHKESGNGALGKRGNIKKHLLEKHKISTEEAKFHFFNNEEYENWKKTSKIDISYTLCRTKKKLDHTEVYYVCNRSNTKGYKSKYKQRTEKTGGSIKMHGICPSRLFVKIYKNGEREVKFQKTHVGHEELTSQRISKVKKEIIVNKLKQGGTKKILDDVKMAINKQAKVNVLSKENVNYLFRKHNIAKKNNCIDMMAVALTVQEQNDAFLFQQQVKSEIRKHHKEIDQFIERNKNKTVVTCMDEKTYRRLQFEHLTNILNEKDIDTFDRCMKKIFTVLKEDEK